MPKQDNVLAFPGKSYQNKEELSDEDFRLPDKLKSKIHRYLIRYIEEDREIETAKFGSYTYVLPAEYSYSTGSKRHYRRFYNYYISSTINSFRCLDYPFGIDSRCSDSQRDELTRLYNAGKNIHASINSKLPKQENDEIANHA